MACSRMLSLALRVLSASMTGGIRFSEENYRVLEDAYLAEAGDVLSAREKDSLRLAVFSISVELAARYLEDYMRGDLYFKTSYPEQNLDKARELIRYVRTMDA